MKNTKIILKNPYAKIWKIGYLNINKEERKTLSLYNSHEDRSSTQYARYLMSVSLGRFLEDDEHVDHIDNDKTNDLIDNLQILSISENNKKEAKKNGIKYAKIKCPVCTIIFEKRAKNTQAMTCNKGRIICCSKKCTMKNRERKFTKEERIKVSESSLLCIVIR